MSEEKTKNIKVKREKVVDVFGETVFERTAFDAAAAAAVEEEVDEVLALEDDDESVISTTEASDILKAQLTATGLKDFFGSKIKSFQYDNGNFSIKFNNIKKNK